MNTLAVQRNIRLTTGQKDLYTLVCQKIQTDDKLLFEEAKKIYLKSVCRNMIQGVPHTWQYVYIPETKDWTSSLEPLKGDYLNFVVLKWLTMALGALILKGYLTVMPAVDLRLLK